MNVLSINFEVWDFESGSATIVLLKDFSKNNVFNNN